jgi:lamin B
LVFKLVVETGFSSFDILHF